MWDTMIHVTVYRNGYTVQGHADYADHGYDIVCAGVSALALSTLSALRQFCLVESTVESGLTDVRVKPFNTKYDLPREWFGCITVFCEGIKSIADHYPDHVKFEYKEVPY